MSVSSTLPRTSSLSSLLITASFSLIVQFFRTWFAISFRMFVSQLHFTRDLQIMSLFIYFSICKTYCTLSSITELTNEIAFTTDNLDMMQHILPAELQPNLIALCRDISVSTYNRYWITLLNSLITKPLLSKKIISLSMSAIFF